MREWPAPVERVASFLRDTGAEARLEEVAADTPTAEAAADAVGCTLGQIVKTLVLMGDGIPVAALVPGDRRVDTGKAARLVDARRVTIASRAEVRSATGFDPGGVSPFPLDRVSACLVERTLLRHRILWVGGGTERHLVSLAPAELVRLTRGRVEDIVVESR